MAWQFSTGNILTAADLNAVTLPWNAICAVRMSAAQSLTNGVSATLLFDTEDLDPRGWHSTVSNTGRITPNIAGWYRMSGTASGQAGTDYLRNTMFFQKNGANLAPVRGFSWYDHTTNNVGPLGAGSTIVQANGSTDYFELLANQSNTGAAAKTVDATFTLQLVYPT